MFPEISYLEWISDRHGAVAHDLGSSDLRGEPTGAGDVVPPSLADLPDPPADADLVGRIAAEYGVDRSNVLVTAGASHANFLAVAAATCPDGSGRPADGERPRVLVEQPGYEPLVATPRGVGATVDRFRRPAEEGYPLDPDRLGAAVTEGTRCITVTNRHNPTGRCADGETLAAASRIAAAADARLLVDEVYAPFTTEAGDAGAFGGPSAAGLPNAVVTSSLTKFHGLADLRVGWLVADEAFVDRARSVGHHFRPVSEPSRRLAVRALHNEERLAERSRERIAENRALLSSFVSDRDDLDGFVAPGCTFAFLGHEAADGDAVAEAALARDLLVIPGRFFDAPERFRLSLGQDPDAMRAGLDVLDDVLDDL